MLLIGAICRCALHAMIWFDDTMPPAFYAQARYRGCLLLLHMRDALAMPLLPLHDDAIRCRSLNNMP